MGIRWFDFKEKDGSASLYNGYLTLNTIAKTPFSEAYRVMVGLNEEGNIVIEPLSKERVLRGDLDESLMLRYEDKRSYGRVSSAALMRQIADKSGLSLTKTPLHFRTEWLEKEKRLIIYLKERGA